MPGQIATELRGPAAAVDGAIGSIAPLVSMWRDGLTVIALEAASGSRPADYLTFDQAVASAELEIREAASRQVPSVEAVTRAHPVLILAGDTLVGGAQNRIVNVTILLKAAAVTPIPVTCLEHGPLERWPPLRRRSRRRREPAPW